MRIYDSFGHRQCVSDTKSAIEPTTTDKQVHLHAGTARSSRWGTGHGRVAQSKADTLWGADCSSVECPAQRRRGHGRAGNLKVVVVIRRRLGQRGILLAGSSNVSDRIEDRAGTGRHRS